MSGFSDRLLKQRLGSKKSSSHGYFPLLVKFLLFPRLASSSVRYCVMAFRRSWLGYRLAIEVKEEDEASKDKMEADTREQAEKHSYCEEVPERL